MGDSDNEGKAWPGGRASSTKKSDLSTTSSSNSGRESSVALSNKTYASGMIPAASRPITQQGLTGLRPPQTQGFGLNRQYHDKRYYVSAIQNHMLLINEEINILKKKLAEHKLDATNYEECKRQVENNTKQLTAHEETLIVYNTAIETSMFKGSKSEIDADAEKLRRANQQKIAQLESIFSDKIAREEQLTKIQQQIEMETQLFNNVLATLSEDKRQEYQDMWETNEDYKKQEEMMKNEIKNLRNAIRLHEHHVVQIEHKRVRYNLLTKLHELNRRRDKIQEENKIKRSPSQEREYLLEQVKHDRADIESFRIQHEDLSNELDTLRERHNELQDELSEKNSARLNKYRELLKRQETMESFLGSYEELYKEEVKKILEFQSSIVFSLEYISGNSIDINFEDIENTQTYSINSNASKEDLQQEYKKFASQLNMLNSINTRIQNESENLKEQEDKLMADLVIFENIDQARDTLLERQGNIEAQYESLKGILQTTRLAVAEAEKKKSDLETQLKFNDAYNTLNELEEKLGGLKTVNEHQKEAIENVKMMDDFEKFRTESLSVLSEIQKKLANRK